MQIGNRGEFVAIQSRIGSLVDTPMVSSLELFTRQESVVGLVLSSACMGLELCCNDSMKDCGLTTYSGKLQLSTTERRSFLKTSPHQRGCGRSFLVIVSFPESIGSYPQ